MFPRALACGRNTYDYVVEHEVLNKDFVGCSVVQDAGFHPHSPVRMYLRGDVRRHCKRMLSHPRKIPALLPSGCLCDPSRHGFDDLASFSDIDVLACKFMSAAEVELSNLMGLSSNEAFPFSGRCG